MKVLFAAPRLEDLWQLHFSQLSGQEYTVPGLFIATTVDVQPTSLPIAPLTPPGARHAGSSASRPQRTGVLDQGLRARRRFIHRHHHPERVREDLRGAMSRHTLRAGRAPDTVAVPVRRN